MTMTTSTTKLRFFGVSVVGPYHREMSQPNQDAWLGGSRKYGTFVVVCDGLGSRPQSGRGASQACLAVRDAIRYWWTFSGNSSKMLLKLIHLFWRIRIEPYSPSECATTCLFAAVSPSGRLIVAGIGDGLIAIKQRDGAINQVLGRTVTEFSNQTTALGQGFNLDDWRLATSEVFEPGTSVLLATDGVADDLLNERVGDFVNWLIREYGELPPVVRHHRLQRELRNWPTPRHFDDKTLAVLYQE